MDDFASTALFNLIASELNNQGFNIKPNQQFSGKTDRQTKATVLHAALIELGPAAILKIGRGLYGVHTNLMANVLMSAATVPDLVQRWQRLEVYFHGNHRIRVTSSSAFNITLQHYALKGDGPSAGEDLVIAGVFAALFQYIGVTGLCLRIADDTLISEDNIIAGTNCPASTENWEYSWKNFNQKEKTSIEQNATSTPAQQVSEILVADIGRNWKLNTMAEVMSVSARTLQRRLAASGTNFQSLLRTTRADCAAGMLMKNQFSLSEIGYACGYSDQAHFSRDFKQRFNLSPSDYQNLIL